MLLTRFVFTAFIDFLDSKNIFAFSKARQVSEWEFRLLNSFDVTKSRMDFLQRATHDILPLCKSEDNFDSRAE